MTDAKRVNKGQFQEGSERARMLGKLGGQRSSKKTRLKAHKIVMGENQITDRFNN